MDVLECIEARRSIRKFKDQEVPDELIEKILGYASWSPSARNSQCWEFIVVKNRETIKKLAEIRGQDFVAAAPVVIVACGNKDLYSNPVTTVAIAVQTLFLAAYANGLGTCWANIYDPEVPERNLKIKQLLGIPEHVDVICLIPMGYPDETPKPHERRSLDEVVHDDRW